MRLSSSRPDPQDATRLLPLLVLPFVLILLGNAVWGVAVATVTIGILLCILAASVLNALAQLHDAIGSLQSERSQAKAPPIKP